MAHSSDILLVSTRSMRHYLQEVLHHLQSFPELYSNGHIHGNDPEILHGNLGILQFADGEMEVDASFSMRDKDVYLICGSSRNPAGIESNEAKIETYHAIDCIRRSSPRRITVVEPYFAPSRSDRTTRRNSVGFWVHAKTMSSLGADVILTFQLHSDKSKTAIDPTRCEMEDIPATAMLMDYMAREMIGTRANWMELQDRWAFCSVDAGGENLARGFAKAFNVPLIVAHKQRDYSVANTVKRINILSDTDIREKEIWIVDDMIDTGGSVVTLVRELAKRGVEKIHIAAVHPVLSGAAVDKLADLADEGLLGDLLLVDTVPITEEIHRRLPFVRVVESARTTAELILRLHENLSLSPFFDPFYIEDYFTRTGQKDSEN